MTDGNTLLEQLHSLHCLKTAPVFEYAHQIPYSVTGQKQMCKVQKQEEDARNVDNHTVFDNVTQCYLGCLYTQATSTPERSL